MKVELQIRESQLNKFKIAIGPESNYASFQWVARDIFDYMSSIDQRYEPIYFKELSELNDNFELVLFIKQLPTPEQLDLLKYKTVCWMPIDSVYCRKDLWKARPVIRQLDAVLLHNSLLKRYLPKEVRVMNVDHYAKYPIEWNGNGAHYLWIGVLEYIPRTVQYLEHNKFFSEKNLVLLTNLEKFTELQSEIELSLKQMNISPEITYQANSVVVNGLKFEQWSEERQALELQTCKAYIDIKSHSFRHQTKPPTKAQIYASTGVPVFLNEEHPAIKIMLKEGVTLKTINALYDMGHKEIETYAITVKKSIGEMYTIESIAKQYVSVLRTCEEFINKRKTINVRSLNRNLKLRRDIMYLFKKYFSKRDKFF